MKAIKALLTGGGLALALLAAGATGARAQALMVTVYSGSIQLPLEAEWQGKALPAGNYNLYYGTRVGGAHYVEIEGKTQGTPHLFIMPQGYQPSSSGRDELICARDGNRLVVLGLQMAGIGESISFAMPRGAQRTAQRAGGATKWRKAKTVTDIQRVPVTTNRK